MRALGAPCQAADNIRKGLPDDVRALDRQDGAGDRRAIDPAGHESSVDCPRILAGIYADRRDPSVGMPRRVEDEPIGPERGLSAVSDAVDGILQWRSCTRHVDALEEQQGSTVWRPRRMLPLGDEAS